jgi:hypothetical protein
MGFGNIICGKDQPLNTAGLHLRKPGRQDDSRFYARQFYPDPTCARAKWHFFYYLAAQDFRIERFRDTLILYRYRDDRNFVEHRIDSFETGV